MKLAEQILNKINEGDIEVDEIQELLDFANAWADMGTSIQKQFSNILAASDDGKGFDDLDINQNAFKVMAKSIGGFNDEIDDLLDDYEKFLKGK